MANEETKSRRIFPRDHKTPLWKRLKWKLEKVYWAVWNIPANVVMICQWIPVLWNNWDWDFNFLLTIIQYKLKRMGKHMAEHDRHTNSQKYAKQMQACADLIDRYFKDEYTRNEERDIEHRWGELIMDSIPEPDEDPVYGKLYRMDIYRVKARELGEEEEEREATHAMYRLADARKQRDLNVLFRIMRKRIEHWWC